MAFFLPSDQTDLKKDLLDDLVIEVMAIQELAYKVFEAEETGSFPPSFEESCDELRTLCDDVIALTQSLKDKVPQITETDLLSSDE